MQKVDRKCPKKCGYVCARSPPGKEDEEKTESERERERIHCIKRYNHQLNTTDSIHSPPACTAHHVCAVPKSMHMLCDN